MPWSFGSSSSKKQKVATSSTTPSVPRTSTGDGIIGNAILPVNLKNNLNVLVVDDNRVCRKILMRMLTMAGVRAQEVENGQEAVNLHQAGSRFHIIFIDKDMPLLAGPQATRIIRSMGVRNMIVGVTGHNRESDKAELMAAGVDEYYEKPLTRENLADILRRVDDAVSNDINE